MEKNTGLLSFVIISSWIQNVFLLLLSINFIITLSGGTIESSDVFHLIILALLIIGITTLFILSTLGIMKRLHTGRALMILLSIIQAVFSLILIYTPIYALLNLIWNLMRIYTLVFHKDTVNLFPQI